MNQSRRAVKRSLVVMMLETQTTAVSGCHETGNAGLRSFYGFVSTKTKTVVGEHWLTEVIPNGQVSCAHYKQGTSLSIIKYDL